MVIRLHSSRPSSYCFTKSKSSHSSVSTTPAFLDLTFQQVLWTMPETRDIVFLGASYAGLGASHYFLRHVYPQLPQDPKIKYKVILVDPSSKHFLRIASPRVIASPDLIPVEKAFLEIEPGYRQYGDKVTLVQAKAISWDEKARTVTLRSSDGEEQTVAYWALVLATGSKTLSPVHSLQGSTHEEIIEALHSTNSEIKKAEHIVLSGGGPTGVETAGEIGETLNGAPGWFSSQPAHPKAKITVITSASKLLPILRQQLSDQAETYLRRVGVEVRYNTKIYSSKNKNGKTILTLHDGEEIETDLYLPTIGVQPLSTYAPAHLKDSKGYIVQNNRTLRVDAAGPRVYAVGDVGSYSNNGILAILDGVPVFGTNIKRDLLAMHSDPTAKPQDKDREYVAQTKELQIVPVGRSKGVGAVFGWRVPSWFVWLIKGRDYMVSKAASNIDGSAWAKEA